MRRLSHFRPTLFALGLIMFGIFGCKKSADEPSAPINTPFQAAFRVPGMT